MKSGLAQMAKGGIVMDVVNADQAKIAEAAGVGTWILCNETLSNTCHVHTTIYPDNDTVLISFVFMNDDY